MLESDIRKMLLWNAVEPLNAISAQLEFLVDEGGPVGGTSVEVDGLSNLLS